MRATRVLALALVALVVPSSRSAAQTCEGNAAFQDGRLRAGGFYQDNGDRNDVGAQLAFGIPHSFFGELTLEILSTSSSKITLCMADLGYRTLSALTLDTRSTSAIRRFRSAPQSWGSILRRALRMQIRSVSAEAWAIASRFRIGLRSFRQPGCAGCRRRPLRQDWGRRARPSHKPAPMLRWKSGSSSIRRSLSFRAYLSRRRAAPNRSIRSVSRSTGPTPCPGNELSR